MLGIVVLVVAVLALRHPTSKSTSTASTTARKTPSSSIPASHSSSAPASHSSSHAASSSTATANPKALPLIVLNTTSTTHLAADASDLFRQAGWKITSSGNYQNNILSTCAYYDPNVTGAKAAATLLQSEFTDILRVKPKFSGLPSGPIVVVLTGNFKTA